MHTNHAIAHHLLFFVAAARFSLCSLALALSLGGPGNGLAVRGGAFGTEVLLLALRAREGKGQGVSAGDFGLGKTTMKK
jgi:hypothetical protein